MIASNLALVIATDPVAARTGLAMIARGTAWALIYVEDAADLGPGATRVHTAIAIGHEHRSGELAEFVRAAAERDGCIVAAPALLSGRGAS